MENQQDPQEKSQSSSKNNSSCNKKFSGRENVNGNNLATEPGAYPLPYRASNGPHPNVELHTAQMNDISPHLPLIAVATMTAVPVDDDDDENNGTANINPILVEAELIENPVMVTGSRRLRMISYAVFVLFIIVATASMTVVVVGNKAGKRVPHSFEDDQTTRNAKPSSSSSLSSDEQDDYKINTNYDDEEEMEVFIQIPSAHTHHRNIFIPSYSPTIVPSISSAPTELKSLQRIKLMQFYTLVDGLTLWNENTRWGSSLDICKWFGIECDGDGEDADHMVVEVIDLSNNNIIGNMTEIGAVLIELGDAFQELFLHGNSGIFGIVSNDLCAALRIISVDANVTCNCCVEIGATLNPSSEYSGSKDSNDDYDDDYYYGTYGSKDGDDYFDDDYYSTSEDGDDYDDYIDDHDSKSGSEGDDDYYYSDNDYSNHGHEYYRDDEDYLNNDQYDDYDDDQRDD